MSQITLDSLDKSKRAALRRCHGVSTERLRELEQMPIQPPAFARKKISEGGSRAVYVHEDPRLVVKCAHTRMHVPGNIAEWWNGALLTMVFGCREHIAPCLDIDPDGAWLIMERTEPLTGRVHIEAPHCLSQDTKLANWGRLNGRIVCHDYSWLNTAAAKEMMAKPSPVTLA